MDISKIFNDLESNQTLECEEAKKKLMETFGQNKEQWVVHYLMDYYLKTGSLRIMEVLVRVQSPHDSYIFDRLADWLKTQANRVHALNFFSFVIRKHPTWIYRVEKHRLFREILKLLLTEKEIVPLMSSLLCIITLLPIIPNLVPKFLDDLFHVFGHLAAWNYENPNRITSDKIVHLQLGLQRLFHRLYGMYPCSFLNYLSNYVKDRNSIFHHTIKPLLETVRLHPLLVTDTAETEVHSWKKMEPHDVVMECAKLSLPVKYQDCYSEPQMEIADSNTNEGSRSASELRVLCSSSGSGSGNNNNSDDLTTTSKHLSYARHTSFMHVKQQQQQQAFGIGRYVSRFDVNTNSGMASNSTIWSPYNEICATTGPIPVTPTPSHAMAVSTTSTTGSNSAIANVNNNQLLGATGSSPPEAAVEATPETTPMKDVKDIKQHVPAPAMIANRYAIRAIFPSSQPSSPLRREQNQFNFNEIRTNDAVAASTINSTDLEREITTTRMVTQVTTTTTTSMYDRRIQQVRQERMHSQSPFQTIESQEAKLSIRSPVYNTPDPDSETSSTIMMLNSTPTPFMLTPTPTLTPVEHIPKMCESCNDTTGRSVICSAGGLHTPTSSSIHLLAKDFRRRNRMTSYCGNDTEIYGSSYNKNDNRNAIHNGKVRRTKSCSSIALAAVVLQCAEPHALRDDVDATRGGERALTHAHTNDTHNEHRLQKSGKMLAIPTAGTRTTNSSGSSCRVQQNVATQTVEIMPHTYESSLLAILEDEQRMRRSYEVSKQTAYDMFEKYISQSVNSKKAPDQEQYQLLWLQLQYEIYRREIYADRNRRLMGRSRTKYNAEMERARLLKQLDSFERQNKELEQKCDRAVSKANERELSYENELVMLKKKYQHELEQNKCLRQANENLQVRLNDEINDRKNGNYEVESLRGQIFNLTNELQHSQAQTAMGLQCKQELARLEAEFIVMGEVQVKCRDRLAELDNSKAHEEEMRLLQESCTIELKELKHTLEEKTQHLDSAKHKIVELQSQQSNSEKIITEQKRLLKTVKDEYEERFKALSKKYEVQKLIILQMEEKIIMSQHKPQALTQAMGACSPDTDKTDVASSMDRNSPLSTSLASSESLSASIRSTELRNLQQLVETPALMEASATVTSSSIMTPGGGGGGSSSGAAFIDSLGLPATNFDLASSANTASGYTGGVGASGITQHIPNLTELRTIGTANVQSFDVKATTTAHLQQQQRQQ